MKNLVWLRILKYLNIDYIYIYGKTYKKMVNGCEKCKL